MKLKNIKIKKAPARKAAHSPAAGAWEAGRLLDGSWQACAAHQPEWPTHGKLLVGRLPVKQGEHGTAQVAQV